MMAAKRRGELCCSMLTLIVGITSLVNAQTLIISHPSPFASNPSSSVSQFVESLGDLDSDGRDDLAVCAPNFSPGPSQNQLGMIAIVSGAGGNVMLTLVGTRPFGNFGTAVARIGDITGDGIDEFSVSSAGLGAGPGIVEVFTIGGVLIYGVSGTVVGEGFGQSLMRVNDLDADGNDDLLIGATTIGREWPSLIGYGTLSTLPEYVQAVSGANGAILATVFAPGLPGAVGTGFGRSLARLEDLNGDGIGEYAIGEPRALVAGALQGAIHVVSGIGGQILQTITVPSYRVLPSFMYAGADLDGDGVGELLCSAVLAAGPGVSAYLSPVTGAIILGAPQVYPAFPSNDGDSDGIDDFLGFVQGSTQWSQISSSTGAVLRSICSLQVQCANSFPTAADIDGNGIIDAVMSSYYGSSLDAYAVGSPLPASPPWAPGGEVLRVGASDGGVLRRVRLSIGEPISFSVLQPTTNPNPAPFVIWGILGQPLPNAAFNALYGFLCFAPASLYSDVPWLFTLTNNFGPDPTSIFNSNLAPWSMTIPNGLPFPYTVTVQGIIQDTVNTATTTNAVVVEIR